MQRGNRAAYGSLSPRPSSPLGQALRLDALARGCLPAATSTRLRLRLARCDLGPALATSALLKLAHGRVNLSRLATTPSGRSLHDPLELGIAVLAHVAVVTRSRCALAPRAGAPLIALAVGRLLMLMRASDKIERGATDVPLEHRKRFRLCVLRAGLARLRVHLCHVRLERGKHLCVIALELP